jgi:hypothetical protein
MLRAGFTSFIAPVDNIKYAKSAKTSHRIDSPEYQKMAMKRDRWMRREDGNAGIIEYDKLVGRQQSCFMSALPMWP